MPNDPQMPPAPLRKFQASQIGPVRPDMQAAASLVSPHGGLKRRAAEASSSFWLHNPRSATCRPSNRFNCCRTLHPINGPEGFDCRMNGGQRVKQAEKEGREEKPDASHVRVEEADCGCCRHPAEGRKGVTSVVRPWSQDTPAQPPCSSGSFGPRFQPLVDGWARFEKLTREPKMCPIVIRSNLRTIRPEKSIFESLVAGLPQLHLPGDRGAADGVESAGTTPQAIVGFLLLQPG